MHGQTYEIDVTLRFDVRDGEAVRRSAWELAALDVNAERGEPDVVADHLAATTERALTVVVTAESWGFALRELAEKIEGLAFAGIAADEEARRVDD
jgi:hypothetical protein